MFCGAEGAGRFSGASLTRRNAACDERGGLLEPPFALASLSYEERLDLPTRRKGTCPWCFHKKEVWGTRASFPEWVIRGRLEDKQVVEFREPVTVARWGESRKVQFGIELS